MKHKKWIPIAVLIVAAAIPIMAHGLPSWNSQSDPANAYDASMRANTTVGDRIYKESVEEDAVRSRARHAFTNSMKRLEGSDMDGIREFRNAIKKDDGDKFMSMIYHEYLLSAGFSMKKDGFKRFKGSLGLSGPMEFLPIRTARYSEYTCYYGYAAERMMHENGESGYDMASARITMITVFDNGKMIPFPLSDISASNIMLERAEDRTRPKMDIMEGAPMLEGLDDEDGTRNATSY